MFFEETINSLWSNKIRSLLAGFGVAWGIFILILLLGIGKGFQSGMNSLLNVYAQKSMILSSGTISKAVMGNNQGKIILFNQKFVQNFKSRFENSIEAISPEVNYSGNSYVSYGNNNGNFLINGITSSYFIIKKVKTKKGRLINYSDDIDARRNVIIGKQVSERLFSKKEPIGEFININGIYFKVVGVLENGSLIDNENENVIYLSYYAFINYFNQGREFSILNILLKNNTNSEMFEDQIREYVSNKYNFSKDDNNALYIMNFETQVKSINKVFSVIDTFLWLIGFCLLLSGMVSISNIMLVIVKERTREIGIRKALGGTPNSILFLILSESVIITSISGFIGMILGFIFLFIVNYLLSIFKPDAIISHIYVNQAVILLALLFIILAGVLAGLYPAKKAAETMPIEAMKFD